MAYLCQNKYRYPKKSVGEACVGVAKEDTICMTIYSAIRFASNAYAGQYREDGSPSIEHPLAVLRLLWQCSMDLPLDVYIAAILHDILEDTTITYKDILEKAGHDVAAMVRMLTKDEAYYALPAPIREYAHLHRLQEISRAYPALPLIKMMDRLHNIQTARALSPGRRQRLFIETQEIYVPLFAEYLEKNPDLRGSSYHYCLERLAQSLFVTPALS